MSEIKATWELVWEVYSKAKGTTWENAIPILVMVIVFGFTIKFVIVPIVKLIGRGYEWLAKKWFVKRQVFEKMSFMDSADLYYALKNYVPTRFTSIDPSNNEEPMPEYYAKNYGSLLIEHFIKYEFSIRHGCKYYLCLGDCGMGKTTFLINLYYQTLKLHKYGCVFVSLQEEKCIEQIHKVDNPAKTILLLDALDENESALTDYDTFIYELEKATKNFYRVIITARTNFFENENKEQLSDNKTNVSTAGKLSNSRKFYIAPFTDEDIRKFLKRRYLFNPQKVNQAWKIVQDNKNLSVRPLLLRFMDELLKENNSFEYDFQLYEYLFGKWIEREKRKIDEELGKGLYEECLLMAKEIYYQWLKNGKIGINPECMREKNTFTGIESIQLKGHALINRTNEGVYKFSHKSYWEFLLAKLAISDYKFSEEILIKNFDKAVAFLEEMIEYGKEHKEKIDVNFAMGIANYYLKYKKTEEAEEWYRYVIDKSDEDKILCKGAQVKISECYRRQLKHGLGNSFLDGVKHSLSDIQINEETIWLYTRFACALAKFRKTHVRNEAQEILKNVIMFYENNNIWNYELLRCYNAYSQCCKNFKLQQEVIEKMQDVIEKKFSKDQYADYLYLCAKSWNVLYKSSDLLDIMKQLNRQYVRFADWYELIINKCDQAISEYSYYHEETEVGRACFDEAIDVCKLVYKDMKENDIDNVYMAKIQYNRLVALVNIKADGVNEIVRMIENYAYKNLGGNSLFCIQTLAKAGQCRSLNFRNREKYLLRGLKMVNDNPYEIVDIYWELFVLYDENNKVKLGQQYLKKAYDYVVQNEEIHMTPVYCDVLRLTLNYYKGEVEREKIVDILLKNTPEIYGKDTRKSRIYFSLMRYFAETNDKRLINVCIRLLEIEVTRDVIEKLYDVCEAYSDRKRFIESVHAIVIEKEVVSSEEGKVLNDFLEAKREELDETLMVYYRGIIKRIGKKTYS